MKSNGSKKRRKGKWKTRFHGSRSTTPGTGESVPNAQYKSRPNSPCVVTGLYSRVSGHHLIPMRVQKRRRTSYGHVVIPLDWDLHSELESVLLKKEYERGEFLSDTEYADILLDFVLARRQEFVCNET